MGIVYKHEILVFLALLLLFLFTDIGFALAPGASSEIAGTTTVRGGAAAVSSRNDEIGVELRKGINGLEKVVLRGVRGSSAEVYLYGAQVLSWKNNHKEELLLVSKKAFFTPPKPIRGGIPISFPQWSNYGPLQSHGFVRNRFWSIDTNPPPFPTVTSNRAFVDLILKPTEEDKKIWPHSFEFRLRVSLSPAGDLSLTSRIRNTNADGKPFSFTFAYHPYFLVSNISEVRVEGLGKLDYLDNQQMRARFTDQGDAITFESEVDRVYLDTPSKIAILDHGKKRTIVLRKHGMRDAVVWNPWFKKIVDFGSDEFLHMVTVEPAAVVNGITLKPGEEWKGIMDLSAVPSGH